MTEQKAELCYRQQRGAEVLLMSKPLSVHTLSRSGQERRFHPNGPTPNQQQAPACGGIGEGTTATQRPKHGNMTYLKLCQSQYSVAVPTQVANKDPGNGANSVHPINQH